MVKKLNDLNKFSRDNTMNVLNSNHGEDALTKDDIKKLLSVLSDLRDEVIIRLALRACLKI